MHFIDSIFIIDFIIIICFNNIWTFTSYIYQITFNSNIYFQIVSTPIINHIIDQMSLLNIH